MKSLQYGMKVPCIMQWELLWACLSLLDHNSHGQICASGSLFLQHCLGSWLLRLGRFASHFYLWNSIHSSMSRLHCESSSRLRISSDPFDKITHSIRSRHSQLRGVATGPLRAALQPTHPTVYPSLPMSSRNSFWLSLSLGIRGHSASGTNGFCRCEGFRIQHSRLQAWGFKEFH